MGIFRLARLVLSQSLDHRTKLTWHKTFPKRFLASDVKPAKVLIVEGETKETRKETQKNLLTKFPSLLK